MNGHENHDKPCPMCGGNLNLGVATIPFMLERHIVVVKDVPAEVCDTCGEPFMRAIATDAVFTLLRRARDMGAEVTILNYVPPTDIAA